MMSARSCFYAVLLCVLLGLNFKYNSQFFVETYMRVAMFNQNIVLAFTTTPVRIDRIEPTVKTILAQNASISAIYLSIPYTFERDGSKYVIPDWLKKYPQIKILRTKDYGPATKLLGVLEQIKLAPNTILITVDDDVFYPSNLVLQLAYQAKLNPNLSIGISGVDPDYDRDGKIDTSSQMGLIKRYEKDGMVTILQGYAGITYRPEFFDDSIFDIQDSPQACKNADDIYFAFYLAKHGHPRRMLRNEYISAYKILWYNSIGAVSDALHLQIPKPAIKHRECIAFLKAKNPDVIF